MNFSPGQKRQRRLYENTALVAVREERAVDLFWTRRGRKSTTLGSIAFDELSAKPGRTVIAASASLLLGSELVSMTTTAAEQAILVRQEAEAQQAVFAESAKDNKLNFVCANSETGKEYKGITPTDFADLYVSRRLEMRLYFTQTTFSRQLVIAPNPATARGWGGTVLRDETGFTRPETEIELQIAVNPIFKTDPSFKMVKASNLSRDDRHPWFEETMPPADMTFPPKAAGHFYRGQHGVLIHRVALADAYAAGHTLYDNRGKPQSYEDFCSDPANRMELPFNYQLLHIAGGTSVIDLVAMLTSQKRGANECAFVFVDTDADFLRAINLLRALVRNGRVAIGVDVATTTGETSNPTSVTVTELQGIERRARMIICWKERREAVQRDRLRKIVLAIQERAEGGPACGMGIDATNERFFAEGTQKALADLIPERDVNLSSVASKRFAAPAGLDWEVYKLEKSTEADRQAEALKYLYNNLVASSVLEQDEVGGFPALIEQMMSAWAYRYSAHEMIWRIDDAGKRQVTAEFRHCPVWFFEARKGRLRFLPDEGAYDGMPMPVTDWLVTVGPGMMRQCSVLYLTKWRPMADWMLYSLRFGVPGIHAITNAVKGTPEWDAQVEQLTKFANDWVTLTSAGTTINLIEAKGGTNLPMQPLVEMSNAGYSIMWRGGDLSTQSKTQAVGSNAQVEEKDVLLAWDVQKLNSTLNARVDRPFIRYLFNTEPKAFVRINLPKKPETDSTIKAAEFLVKSGSKKVGLSDMHARLGIPEAEEGVEVLTAPATPAAPPTAEVPPLDALANEAALDEASRQMLAQAMAAAVQALLHRIAAANEILDPVIRAASLQAILTDYDALKKDLQKDNPVAGALMQIQATAFANGLETKPKTS